MKQVTLSERAVEKIEELQDPDLYFGCKATIADAFAVFKKEGIFNSDTAQRFRDCILSKGGTEHPMTLYKRFKGSEPTIDALLERNGIKK